MNCILGMDTSNYKTSLALISGNTVAVDLRRFLKVKEGARGLRQSDALFQHVQNLPELFAALREQFDGNIDGVAFSARPRAVEGSYMPCFTAGVSQAVSIASALDVPAVGFSHQENHIEAALTSCGQRPDGAFLACHFSGGTCEVLRVRPKEHAPLHTEGFRRMDGERAFYGIEIIGGTKDISYGQVLDRAGVLMGLPFPCGQALDEMALAAADRTSVLTAVKVQDASVHLSGFDTQIRRMIAEAKASGQDASPLVREVFEKISDSVVKMLSQSAQQAGIHQVYLSGGVASSRFLRENITERLREQDIDPCFAAADMSSDNAVGTAFLGRRYLWG